MIHALMLAVKITYQSFFKLITRIVYYSELCCGESFFGGFDARCRTVPVTPKSECSVLVSVLTVRFHLNTSFLLL